LPIVSMWILCSLSLMIWITHVSLMISESYDLKYSLLLSTTLEGW
jgi:hypothetical protein